VIGNQKVTYIFCRNSKQGADALNRLTGLNWGKMPKSLVNCIEEESELSETALAQGKVAKAGKQ